MVSRGEGERKQVTVLFADMKGSMELLADRDPEEARALPDPVLELMMEAGFVDVLLDALVGGDPELTPLELVLTARTDGNPFFLEESVRTLSGSSACRRAASSSSGRRITCTSAASAAARATWAARAACRTTSPGPSRSRHPETCVELHGLCDASAPYAAAFMNWADDPFGGGVHFWNIRVKSWELIPRIAQPKPPLPNRSTSRHRPRVNWG